MNGDIIEGVRIVEHSHCISGDEDDNDENHHFSLDASLSSRCLSIKDGKLFFTTRQSLGIIKSIYDSPTNLLKGENIRKSFPMNGRIAMDDSFTAQIFDAPLSMNSSSDESCKSVSELPSGMEESNSVVTLDWCNHHKFSSFRTELESECPFLQLQHELSPDQEISFRQWDVDSNHNHNLHNYDVINDLESSTNQLLLNESCNMDMNSNDAELPSLYREFSDIPEVLLQPLQSQLENLLNNPNNAIFLSDLENISMFKISPILLSLSKEQENNYRLVFHLRQQIAEIFIDNRDFVSALTQNMQLVALLHSLLPNFTIYSLISLFTELEIDTLGSKSPMEDSAIYNLYYDRILVAKEVRCTNTWSLHETLLRQERIDKERANYQCLETFMEMLMLLISDTSLLWGEIVPKNDGRDTRDTKISLFINDLPDHILSDSVEELRKMLSNYRSSSSDDLYIDEDDADGVSTEDMSAISHYILQTLRLILLLYHWWRIVYLKDASMDEQTAQLLVNIAQVYFEQENWVNAMAYFTQAWTFLEGKRQHLLRNKENNDTDICDTSVDDVAVDDILEWQAQVNVSLSLCCEQLHDPENCEMFLQQSLLLREMLYSSRNISEVTCNMYNNNGYNNANNDIDIAYVDKSIIDQIHEVDTKDASFVAQVLDTCSIS